MPVLDRDEVVEAPAPFGLDEETRYWVADAGPGLGLACQRQAILCFYDEQIGGEYLGQRSGESHMFRLLTFEQIKSEVHKRSEGRRYACKVNALYFPEDGSRVPL